MLLVMKLVGRSVSSDQAARDSVEDATAEFLGWQTWLCISRSRVYGLDEVDGNAERRLLTEGGAPMSN